MNERLKNLDFYFISEVRHGLYEKIYAKDVAYDGVYHAHLVSKDRVCFWDKYGSDHACCIQMENILMAAK